MLDQQGLSHAIDAYEVSVREALESARKLILPLSVCISFNTGQLDESGIDALVKRTPKLPRGEGKTKARGFIYIYRLDGACEGISSALKELMKTAKEEDPEIGKLPSINGAHTGQVLYVGRSWDVHARTKQHLSARRSRGTYALRFSGWAKDHDLDVELHIWEFPGISGHTLQVLEDGLWDRLQPLFGRRGAK